jgi:hypothetical protein
MLKVFFATLSVAIGFSSLATATDPNVSLILQKEEAADMIAKSRPTRREQTIDSVFYGEKITYSWNVYEYDSNWTCYVANRKFPMHSGARKLVYGSVPLKTYCEFKLGSNPTASMKPAPEKANFELHRMEKEKLMANAKYVGEQSINVAGYLGSKDVEFKISRLGGWECREVKSSFSMPLGAKVPKESCVYTPTGTESATVQTADFTQGVVR